MWVIASSNDAYCTEYASGSMPSFIELPRGIERSSMIRMEPSGFSRALMGEQSDIEAGLESSAHVMDQLMVPMAAEKVK